jgi:hypothetical protein
METEQLKEKLQTIASQDYGATREDIQALVPVMLKFIGVPDSELRDKLIYSTLATWIYRGNFSSNELQELLQQVLDNEHLFYKLGEENTDSVFTRAFSVLLLPPVLWYHCQQPFLTSEILKGTLQKVMFYLYSEKDLRGYEREKGWAHAVAHTAGALGGFVECKEIGRDELIRILELITQVASTEKSVYTHGEDERLSFTVINIFRRSELKTEEKVAWLESFTLEVQKAGPMPDPEGYCKSINVKHFLRTLYFEFLRADLEDKQRYLETIQTLLKNYSEL